MTEPRGESKAVVKAISLLNVLNDDGPKGVSELARELGLPKGTVHRLLVTLQQEMLVVEHESGYDLGPHCIVLGSTYLQRVDLRTDFRDSLAELSKLTGETVHLGLPDGARVIYIDKVDGPHAVGMRSRIGSSAPLYSSGLGKALLAWSTPQVLETVIARGLTPRTPRTIVDSDVLRRELRAIVTRGYAIDDVENEEGIRCVGAAVRDHEGVAVAAISVAGPSFRMTRKRARELGPLVAEMARGLSARLGFVGEDPSPPPPHAVAAADRGAVRTT